MRSAVMSYTAKERATEHGLFPVALVGTSGHETIESPATFENNGLKPV
jgi:hypothetical protein